MIGAEPTIDECHQQKCNHLNIVVTIKYIIMLKQHKSRKEKSQIRYISLLIINSEIEIIAIVRMTKISVTMHETLNNVDDVVNCRC